MFHKHDSRSMHTACGCWWQISLGMRVPVSPTGCTRPTAHVIHFRHTVWIFSPLCHTIIVINKRSRGHLAISTSTFIQWNLFLHYSQSHWPIKLILTCVHLISNKNDWCSKTSHFTVSSTIASLQITNQRWPSSLTNDFLYRYFYLLHTHTEVRTHDLTYQGHGNYANITYTKTDGVQTNTWPHWDSNQVARLAITQVNW